MTSTSSVDVPGALLLATDFAAAKHRGQRRSDDSPYINHPIAVATLLAVEGGVADVDLLCAAVLHDTLGHTHTTTDEIAGLLNSAVANLVLEVTDQQSLPQAERELLQIDTVTRLSVGARLIKLADICCNLTELLQRQPLLWTLARKQACFDSAARTLAALRGTHPALEARLDALLARRIELY